MYPANGLALALAEMPLYPSRWLPMSDIELWLSLGAD